MPSYMCTLNEWNSMNILSQTFDKNYKQLMKAGMNHRLYTFNEWSEIFHMMLDFQKIPNDVRAI